VALAAEAPPRSRASGDEARCEGIMSQNTHPLIAPEANAVKQPPEPAPPAAASSPAPPEQPPRPSIISWLFGFVPSLLILGLLGYVGVWGLQNDWDTNTLPIFGETKKPETPSDWCDDHVVPKSICIECSRDKKTKTVSISGETTNQYGWCDTHGVHECPLEHPDIAQLTKMPRIYAEDLARAKRALDLTPRPENHKPCKLHPRVVQFASSEGADRAKIEVPAVEQKRLVEAITVAGETTYEHGLIAHLASRLPGTIWRVLKKYGDSVRRGEVIALIDAAEVGRVKTEYLQAVAQLDLRTTVLTRLKGAEGAVPEAKVLEAQTAVQEAQLRLLGAEQHLGNLGFPVHTETLRNLPPAEIARRMQFLGLPDDLVRTFDAHSTISTLLPLTAPFDGVVVEREAVAGEVVDPTKMLFIVADPRILSLSLHVPQEEAGRIKRGDKIEFTPDGSTKPARGAIAWISPGVEPKTRTVEVRADLDNKAGLLRAGAFGSGRIILREEPKAILVRNEAIHWDGTCHIVFVRDKNYFKTPDAPKVFHVRSVRIGARSDEYTEIIAGVLPGELVATRHSVILRGQLLIGSMGEGCGCGH